MAENTGISRFFLHHNILPEPFSHGYVSNPLGRMPCDRNQGIWQAALDAEEIRFVLFDEDEILVRSSGQALKPDLFFSLKEAGGKAFCRENAIMLGRWQGVVYAACRAVEEHNVECKRLALRDLTESGVFDDALYSLLAQARSLVHWHVRTRFCSACGARLRIADAGTRRVCVACAMEHFPRVDPAVIMLVIDVDNKRLLLGRHDRLKRGFYSTLAGFVEPGETIEGAVRREALEESGVHVGAVRYMCSQPWPYPSNLMIGCIGEALSCDLLVDKQELLEARWFELEEAKQMYENTHPKGWRIPLKFTISHTLISLALKNERVLWEKHTPH